MRKLVASVLAVVCVIGLSAGCSNQSRVTQSTPSTQPTAPTQLSSNTVAHTSASGPLDITSDLAAVAQDLSAVDAASGQADADIAAGAADESQNDNP